MQNVVMFHVIALLLMIAHCVNINATRSELASYINTYSSYARFQCIGGFYFT